MSVVFIVRVSVTLNVTLSSPILRSNVTLPLWSSGSDVTLASRNVTFEAGDVTLGLLDADLNVTLPGERGCQSHSGPCPSRSTLRGAGSDGGPSGTARSSPHLPASASHSRSARSPDRRGRRGQSAFTD
jgi:hypothetical protein